MRWTLVLIMATLPAACVGVVDAPTAPSSAQQENADIDGPTATDDDPPATDDSQATADNDIPPTDDDSAPLYSTNPADFYGTPRCAGKGYVLCDDFESQPVGAAPDPKIWTSPANARIDNARAARGAKSVRITMPTQGSQAYLSEGWTFAKTGNAFFGRVFYYVEASGPQTFVHWNIIEATGPGTPGGPDWLHLVRYGGTANNPFLGKGNNDYIMNYEHWGQEPGFNETGASEQGKKEPIGQWVCLEWLFDGNKTEARLWKDGVENQDVHITSLVSNGKSYKMPTFTAFNIGWATYQNVDVGYEVWIDEVAVDTKRIGCNR